MHAATDRLEFAPPTPPGALRAIGLAVLAHALLVLALTWGLHWRREAETVTAEAELWSSVPVEAAPQLQEAPPEPPPPPEPVQQPAPPPPAPVATPPQVDIALQQEKLRLKKQKEKEQAKLEEKRLEKLKLEKLKQEQLKQQKLKEDKIKQDKLKQEQADKAKKAAQDKKQAELEAKQLEANRAKNLQRIAGMAGASGSANATGNALKSAGPSASYGGRIRARVKPNIVFTEDVSGNPEAEVEVRTAPDGTIVGRRLTKSSGVKAWDDAVLKAIDKTEKLPRDTDGTVPSSLLLVFRPKD